MVTTLPADAMAGVEGVIRSGGRPLDPTTRHSMESRFGSDFQDVRIHTRHEADEATNHFKARAFTVGKDIVFGDGEYRPRETRGRHLLAHQPFAVSDQAAPQFNPDVMATLKTSLNAGPPCGALSVWLSRPVGRTDFFLNAHPFTVADDGAQHLGLPTVEESLVVGQDSFFLIDRPPVNDLTGILRVPSGPQTWSSLRAWHPTTLTKPINIGGNLARQIRKPSSSNSAWNSPQHPPGHLQPCYQTVACIASQ